MTSLGVEGFDRLFHVGAGGRMAGDGWRGNQVSGVGWMCRVVLHVNDGGFDSRNERHKR